MINNEGELAKDVQTLRQCPDGQELKGACAKAFNEVLDFMKQPGALQDQLKSRNLITTDGKSIQFSPMLYPSEKE